jgi:hypothetical protein
MNTDVTRREFLATVAAAQGAFVLGFWMPEKARAQAQTPSSTPPGAAWYEEPTTPEVNAWIVVAPDDTVTIRIAQTELGQGVWTSNAMMVCEELQCDWTKVRPQYASANRDARERAPAWTLAQERQRAHDHAGLAVAALRRVKFLPGELNGVRAVRRHAFDGHDRLADCPRGRDAARAHGAAVDVHGAGTALPDAAAEFRACQADMIAYDPQQGRLRIGIDAVCAPVDDQVERHAFVLRVGAL